MQNPISLVVNMQKVDHGGWFFSLLKSGVKNFLAQNKGVGGGGGRKTFGH